MKRLYPVIALVAILLIGTIAYFLLGPRDQPPVETTQTSETLLQATAGKPGAQMEMARRFFIGEGVEKDEARGAEWTRRAAEGGSVRAQGLMGVLYLGGIGVQQSFEEARKWFSLSPDKEAQVLAQRLQLLMEATAKLPEAEQAARKEADYAAARKDIRSSFLKVLEKPE